MSTNNSNESIFSPLSLDNYLLDVQELLYRFIADVDFSSKIKLAFGSAVDIVQATTLIQKLANPLSPDFPKIEIISQQKINGARGAFASSNNTIYLSQEFLAENINNSSLIVSVLAEELGHFVDSQLNASDTQGDEGELFSALVRGVELSDGELQSIKTEDDSAIVTIDGETLQIEQFEPNDTPSQATSLSLVQGYESVDDSLFWKWIPEIRQWRFDVDIYNFRISGIGAINNYIKVSSFSSSVDLVLELRDQFGNLVRGRQNPANSNNRFNNEDGETIPLAGLPSGTYNIIVYDSLRGSFANSAAFYNIEFFAPPAPDTFDDRRSLGGHNDFLTKATEIKAVDLADGIKRYNSLSIDSPFDTDWFKFTTTSTATGEDYIEIKFDNTDGNLALALWYPFGNAYYPYVVDTTSDSEKIPLAGLPAGTYYIQVGSYGTVTNNAFFPHTNPDYDLIVKVPKTPQEDRLENNDSLNPTNLGTVRGLYFDDRLTIHNSNDRDYFQFTIDGNGTPDNYISISFDSLKGDLGLGLYDSNKRFLGFSDNYLTNTETISLAGLKKGTYFAQVASTPRNVNEYTLVINAPGTNANALSSDRFEPNDTRSTLSDLGLIRGASSIPYLSIGSSTDTDNFKFKLDATGEKGDFVAISYDTYKGDLDLRLYDYDGSFLIESASGFRNNELISLEGLGAGNYYVEVRGYKGATGNYTLNFSAPGDPYEDNDSQNKASNLGSITGIRTFGDLSAKRGDDDWFRFQLKEDGTRNNFVRIDFTHALGNLNFSLYRNDNAGGNLDNFTSNKTSIDLSLEETSSSTKNFEEISLNGLDAGEYFLKVTNSDSTNNAYNLTINATYDDEFDEGVKSNNKTEDAVDLNADQRIQGLGYIDNTQNPLSIHSLSDVDWFKFTLREAPKSGDFAAIVFDTTQGDIDLELYDSNGTTLKKGSYGVSNTQQINLDGLNLQANTTYYLKAFSPAEATDRRNPAYRLVLNAPVADPSTGDAYEPNNSTTNPNDRTNASDLGNKSNTFSRLSIHNATDVDWFKFNLDHRGTSSDAVAINFNNNQGDLDLELYDSLTSNTPIKSSRGNGDSESFDLAGLPEGLYYVKVSGAKGATNPNYNLSLNLPGSKDWADTKAANNTGSTPTDLRNVEGLQTWNPLSIHTAEDIDWFKFTIPATSTALTKEHYASIVFDKTLGDLDLKLWNTYVTPQEIRSGVVEGNSERIDLSGLVPGRTYFLQVKGSNDKVTNPSYQLFINAPTDKAGDWSEPNNSTSTPFDLKEVQGTQTYSGLSLHQGTDEDWFTFTTVDKGVQGHSVSLAFDNTQGNLNLQVYKPDGTLYKTSASDSNSERVSLDTLPAGTYKVRVYGSENPNYSLTIDAPQTPQADWADKVKANNSLADAYNLRTINGTLSLGGLSIHPSTDTDWFKFTLDRKPVRGQFARINFNHYEGDLSLELLDSAGNRIGSSTTTNNVEQISLFDTITQAGTYYIKVSGVSGATNPDYSLTIDGIPELRKDQAEANAGKTDNNTFSNAFDLKNLGEIGDSIKARSKYDPYDGLPWEPSLPYDPIWNPYSFGGINLSGNQLWQVNTDTLGLRQFQPFQQLGTSLATELVRPLDPYGINAAAKAQTVSGFQDVVQGILDTASGRDQWTPPPPSPEELRQRQIAEMIKNEGYRQEAIAREQNFLGQFDFGGLGALSGSGGNILPSLPINQFYSGSGGGWGGNGWGGNGWGGGGWGNSGWGKIGFSANNFQYLQVKSNLSIEASDQDWFKFELPDRGGEEGQFIGINFDNDLGNLKLELFDAFNLTTPFEIADGKGDSEQISLAGLAKGTYYARISGVNGATNPDYTLLVNVPPANAEPDWFDTRLDNTLEDFGTVDGFDTRTNLSIHSGDTDWFQFTINTPNLTPDGYYARIDFDHSLGDLDLELYNATGTTRLDKSTTTKDYEEISLKGLAAGTYRAKVSGYKGATNPYYSLSIFAPENVTSDGFEPNDESNPIDIDRQPLSINNYPLTIHKGDLDYFKFTIPANTIAKDSNFVKIEYTGDQGQLNLAVYKEGSPNTPITTSTLTTDSKTISLNGQQAGTYIIKVSGQDSNTANQYQLFVDTPTNNAVTSSTAPQLNDWTFLVYMTGSDLNQYAFQSINEMELAASQLPGTVNFAVLWDQSPSAGNKTTYATGGSLPWSGTGVSIIRPDSDINTITSSFQGFDGINFSSNLNLEANTGNAKTLENFIKWATGAAPAQNYSLILWDHGNGDLDGFNVDNEGNSAQINADRLFAEELTQAITASGIGSKLKLIAFDACLMAMAEVAYSLRNYADVFVGSQEVETAGGWDYSTAFTSLLSNPSQTTASDIATDLVNSYQAKFQGDRRGWDTLSAIDLNQLKQPELVTKLKTFTTQAVSFINSNTNNATLLNSARDAATSFFGVDYLRDMGQFLEAIANNNAIIPNLKDAAKAASDALDKLIVAKSADKRDTSGLSIFLPNTASTLNRGNEIIPNATNTHISYNTRNSDFLNQTGWKTFLDSFVGKGNSNSIAPDWAENNDVAARSFDFHTLVGNGHQFTGLNLHKAGDNDWYRFELARTGATSVSISNGLSFNLYQLTKDAGNSTRTQVSPATPQATVSLANAAQGDYLIEVVGGSTPVPNYSLSINAPGTPNNDFDWAKGNDTLEKAESLGVISTETVFSGLQLDTNNRDDWFTFELPKINSDRIKPVQVTVNLTGNQTVTAQLFDPNDSTTPIATKTGTGTLQILTPNPQPGRTYQLKISQPSAATAYSLRIDPTIVTNNPIQPSLTITNSNPVTIVEGLTTNTNLVFTVSLSAVSSQTVTVNYTTVNGTATAGSDYTATSGTLTFAPNQTSQTITVPILNDNLNEPNETFTVTLSNPVNATIGQSLGTGTITDTLRRAVTTTLAAGVENLALTGTGNINGTGNANNNVITGNAGNNILNGGAGNDRLIGGLGNDTLTGGTGSDRFTFNNPNQRIDQITDFISSQGDKIVVSAAGFQGGLVAGASITTAQFVLGTTAQDASDRFIYNRTTGGLFFDRDGTGALSAIQIATLISKPSLTSTGILVVA